MLTRIRKIRDIHLIAGVLAALLLASLLGRTVSYVRERSARSSGELATLSLDANDFTMSGIKDMGDYYLTTDNDPQMLFEREMTVVNVKFAMKTSLEPGEIVLYYMNEGDLGFSPRKRAWAKPDGTESGYVFTIPMQKVTAIRVDPTMYPSNRLTFGEFTVNADSGAGDHFRFNAGDVFDLLIYTGIISALLMTVKNLVRGREDGET